MLTLVVVISLTFIATIKYLKYDLKKTATEEYLNEIISSVNSTPSLPQAFKDTYSKVYPSAFSTNFTFSIIHNIFGTGHQSCECGQLANQLWFSNKQSRIRQHLDYVAFVLTLEDNISQEKCFEYRASNSDFLYNAIGIHQAALTYFDKTLEVLTVEEQLGLILKLKNPSLYNERRRPETYADEIKKLKDETEE